MTRMSLTAAFQGCHKSGCNVAAVPFWLCTDNTKLTNMQTRLGPCFSSVSWSQIFPWPQCGYRCELKKRHWCNNGDDIFMSPSCEAHKFPVAMLMPDPLVPFSFTVDCWWICLASWVGGSDRARSSKAVLAAWTSVWLCSGTLSLSGPVVHQQLFFKRH